MTIINKIDCLVFYSLLDERERERVGGWGIKFSFNKTKVIWFCTMFENLYQKCFPMSLSML